MDIDVKKLSDILSKGEGVSYGVFELDGSPAVGALFVSPEHMGAVEEYAKTLLDTTKEKRRQTDGHSVTQ
jgi:hypothetical protein